VALVGYLVLHLSVINSNNDNGEQHSKYIEQYCTLRIANQWN